MVSLTLKRLILILIFLCILFFSLGYYYSIHSGKSPIRIPVIPSDKPNLTPTPSTVSVLGSSTAKCHAIHLNPDDDQAYLPDEKCTPGVADPAVTQDNIHETVCKTGYTKTVRPDVSYTSKLKKIQITDYGYPDTDMRNYEEDHLIPLGLGGSPDDPKNLWPEPHPSFNKKDETENYLRQELCAGRISLLQAQAEISGNWYQVYTDHLK
jgi:hypothetical protein